MKQPPVVVSVHADRGPRRGLRAAFVACALATSALACGGATQGEAQPVDAFRWPGAMRIGGGGKVLYVVGTDFDLSYGSGVVQSLDLAALNEQADGASAGSSPEHFDTLPLLGGVQISPFGGAIASMPTDGGERLFVPIRGGGETPGRGQGGGSVAVIDATPDGSLSCVATTGLASGIDCRDQQVPLVTPGGDTVGDPFSAVVAGDHLFVGSISAQPVDPLQPAGTTASYEARLAVGDPSEASVRDAKGLLIQALALAPAGDLVFAAGLTSGTLAGAIRSFDPRAWDTDLAGSQTALNGTLNAHQISSLVFSADGGRLYALSSPLANAGPSALVVLRREGPTAVDLVLEKSVPLAETPAHMVRVDGPHGDLIAVTSSTGGAVSIVDPTLPFASAVVAEIDGTACPDASSPCPVGARQGERYAPADPGKMPYGIVATDRAGGGVRLWVGGFDEGRLSAIDIPDTARPWEARIVAVFSTGSAS